MTAPKPEPDCQLHLAHADDGLFDVYMRGGYPDMILPVTVFRPLDAALDLTKLAVLDRKVTLALDGLPTRPPRSGNRPGRTPRRSRSETSGRRAHRVGFGSLSTSDESN